MAAVPLIARVPCPAENALCDKGESAARRGLPYKSYRTAYAPRGLRLPDGAHRANRVPTRKDATHLLGASAISSAFRILDEAFSPPKAEESAVYHCAAGLAILMHAASAVRGGGRIKEGKFIKEGFFCRDL